MKLKKKNLKKLKKSAKNLFVTLHPLENEKYRFKASFVEFKGYLDLFITIESLINVCIIATQNSKYCLNNSGNDIGKSLELVRQLLPIEEGEHLDNFYKLISKKPGTV